MEATPEQLAFVPSTTYGLNGLLQRLELPPGSKVLLPDHGYNATVNLVHFAYEQRGWTPPLVPIPLPLEDSAQVVEAFAAQQQGIQVPVIPLQAHAAGSPEFIRVSLFAYNTLEDIQTLAEAVAAMAPEVMPVA